MKKMIVVVLTLLFISGCAVNKVEPAKANAKTLTAVKVDPDLDRKTTESGGVKRVAAPYRETVLVNGHYRKNIATGVYSFQMQPGFLRAQVEELLLNHPLIKSTDSIVWKASSNFKWQGSFTAEGESYEHVLDKILSGYALEAVFRANNVVIIQPLK